MKKSFGLPETTNITNTNVNTTEKTQSELYLNVLFKFGDDYISLNYGIGLDGMPDSKLSGTLGAHQNQIRDLLISRGQTIKPGESAIIFTSDEVQLELRRRGKTETSTNVDEDLAKAFLEMLL